MFHIVAFQTGRVLESAPTQTARCRAVLGPAFQQVLCLVAVLGLTPLTVQAQTGILAPSRVTDWTKAGVAGGIPTRNTICATLNCTERETGL